MLWKLPDLPSFSPGTTFAIAVSHDRPSHETCEASTLALKEKIMKSQGVSNLFIDLTVTAILLPLGLAAWALNTAAEMSGALRPQKPVVQPRLVWTQRTVTFGPSAHTLASTG
jgi:hypothetical protein